MIRYDRRMNILSLRRLLLLPVLLVTQASLSLEVYDPWIQGAMVRGATEPDSQLRFLDRTVEVDEQGRFVVGLGRDAKANVELEEVLATGEKIVHSFSVQQRSYREQRIEGVPNRTVQVPESALKRIREEVQLTKQARRVNSTRNDFLQEFQWPSKGIITGVYGSRRFYNGEARRPHYGIDIAAPQGSPVVAPVAGKVTLVHEDMYFSGGTLIVDHGRGISSTFIHLYKILVEEGQEVEQGQVIAEIGASGRATGPHLDWRMNWFNQRLDPQLLMRALPEKHASQLQ